MASSDQSRVLGAGKEKNFSEILFQQNTNLLDSELNVLQKVIFNRMRELVLHGLKYDSGFIKKSTFTAGSTATTFKMGSLTTDVNRANINGFIVDILGTASTNDYENIIEMPAKPLSGSRNDLVFIEVWETILEFGKDQTDDVNKPSASTIYRYGNTLYGGTNVNDEIKDLVLGKDTAERIQIQYEIRVAENATSLVGLTCKDGIGTFSQAIDQITGETLNGLYVAQGTDTQYAITEYDENNNPLGYGFHWAIPICIVPRTDAESSIDFSNITDLRMMVGVTALDPDADYTINKLTTTDDIEVGGNIFPSSSSGHTIGKPGFTWDALYLSSSIYYTTNLNFNSGGDRITFTTDGKAGLGTTAPSAPIHIEKTDDGNLINQIILRNAGTSDSSGGYIQFQYGSGTAIGNITGVKTGTDTGALSFWTNNSGLTEKARITADGKLGLGTDAPIQKFDVRGNSYFSGHIGIRTDADAVNPLTVQAIDNTLGFTLQNSGYNSIAEIWPDASGHGVLTLRESPTTKKIELRANGTSYILGNVGIGTDVSSEKFQVYGGNTKVEDLILGNTPVRIKEVLGEVQLRNYADTNFLNLRLNNLTVKGTFTSEISQEVILGDNEILVNGLIDDFSNNSDSAIRFKLLDDHSVRTIQSITSSINKIVVNTLNGIIAEDFIQVKNTVNGNDGMYKVVSVAGSGPYDIIIDNSFKALVADEGVGGNVARGIGSRFRWDNSNGRFVVERINGNDVDLLVQGNIYGKSDNSSTLGTASNRFATLYMASTIDYASNLAFTYNSSGEKMRLTSSGWLGLGTNSPLSILDVYRNVGSTAQIVMRNPNVLGAASIQATSDVGGVSLQSIGSSNPLTSLQGYGRVRTDVSLNGFHLATGNGPIHISPADTIAMTVLPNGNVGLGTTNPSIKLQLNVPSNTGAIGVFTSGGAARGIIGLNATNDGEIYLQNNSGISTVYFKANGDSYLTGGNLGLGTSTITERLHVNGNIYSSGSITAGTNLNASTFKTNNITITANDIYEHYTNGDTGTVWINRKGYLDGISMYRDFKVDDGKGNVLLSAIGSTQYISTTGRLGVGTDAPVSKLHVNEVGNFTALQISKLGTGVGTAFYLDNRGTGNHITITTDGGTTFPFVINNAGRVGIGTSSPGTIGGSIGSVLTNLHVKNTNTRFAVEGSSSATIDLYDTGASLNQKWFTFSNDGGKTKFVSNNDAGSLTYTFLTMDHANGYVGVGTSIPSAKLQVEGDIVGKADNTSYLGSTNNRWAGIYMASNVDYLTSLSFNISGSNKLNIENDGSVNITGGGSFKLNGSPFASSQWTQSGSNIYFNSGNVGIGTNNPLAKLHLRLADPTGAAAPISTYDILTLDNNTTNYINMRTTSSNISGIMFSDNVRFVGAMTYNHTDNKLRFYSDSAERVQIDSNGLSVISGSISGPNVTSGSDPGHTHTAYSLTSHTHAYDNYGDWNLFVNGSQVFNVTSAANIGWTAGTNVTLGWGSNTITINAGNANWDTAYSHTLSTSNPHSVTYTQVGAAAASHNHDSAYVNATGDTMSGNLLFNNYGLGIVGLYSATRYQLVWAMGSAYLPSADGLSTGSTYGLLWTHSNIGGQSIAGLGHQLLIQTAGATRTAIGDGIWTGYNITTSSYGSANQWKAGYDHSLITTGNPHNLDAADVGAAAASHTHAEYLANGNGMTIGAPRYLNDYFGTWINAFGYDRFLCTSAGESYMSIDIPAGVALTSLAMRCYHPGGAVLPTVYLRRRDHASNTTVGTVQATASGNTTVTATISHTVSRLYYYNLVLYGPVNAEIFWIRLTWS